MPPTKKTQMSSFLPASQSLQSELARCRPAPRRQKRIRYAEVTIAAMTGAMSATHLLDPANSAERGSTSGIWSLEHALADLASGGYVIDLRPLAERPEIISWVLRAPLPNGKLEGDDIERLPDEVREAAGELAPGLEDEYLWLAYLAVTRSGEPNDGSAGPFDGVSAAALATYWRERGALIGQRRGKSIFWSDGRQQRIIRPAR